MRVSRVFRLLAGMLAVGIAASCATDRNPTAPAPNHDLVGGAVTTLTSTVGSVLQCKKLPDYSNSGVIGSDGGTITVGPHTLVIPAGALSSPVTITAYAPSDKSRDVQFGPAGLTFAKPASLTLSYDGCSLLTNLLPKVAYTTDLLAILYYVPSTADAQAHTVTGQINHFSRYAAAY